MGSLHPQIVHFVIVPALIGLVFRIVSLTGKLQFTRHAATVLLLVAAVASVFAVTSGEDAHGPAERIPGVGSVVHEHEEYGEMARTLLILVGVLELGALALGKRKQAQWLLYASALVGLAGCFYVYEAAEHGGELVYSYAGGVGKRTGDPEDVERLLIAGLYHQSVTDREAGRHEDAARLVEEMVARRPDDVGVRLLAARSLIEDRKDGEAALAALDGIDPGDSRRARYNVGMLKADAWLLVGDPAAARAELERLAHDFPDSDRLRERLESLGSVESEEPEEEGEEEEED